MAGKPTQRRLAAAPVAAPPLVAETLDKLMPSPRALARLEATGVIADSVGISIE